MNVYTDVDLYYLAHHGIEGQKWGVTNGPPYPLDYEDHSAAERRAMAKMEAKDSKWAAKNDKRLQDEVKKNVARNVNGLKEYGQQATVALLREVSKNPDTYLRVYYDKLGNKHAEPNLRLVAKMNQIMADSCNKFLDDLEANGRLGSMKVSQITAPSGRVVRFVAKRGESGMFTALVTPGYDMSNVKNGANAKSGKVGYRDHTLRKI